MGVPRKLLQCVKLLVRLFKPSKVRSGEVRGERCGEKYLFTLPPLELLLKNQCTLHNSTKTLDRPSHQRGL